MSAPILKHPIQQQSHKAGLRRVQIWVPDTRSPDFANECRRQCLLVALADSEDTALQQFMDNASADIE